MTSFYLASVSYVGTRYSGFQIQSTLPTIQGTIWNSLKNIDPMVGLPSGASRTDAGVHAEDQKVFFKTEKPWDLTILKKAIQAYLHDDIQINTIHAVPEDFTFKKAVVAKRYCYRLATGPQRNPKENFHRWYLPGSFQIDLFEMNKALKYYLGTHDFSSFRASECVALSPIKTLYRFELIEDSQGLSILFDGNQFLMHQIRILTGTLVEFMKNKFTSDDLRSILVFKDRTKAGPTAPPHGLTLEKIWLDPALGLNEPYNLVRPCID